jgi:hypothetical protein
MTLERFCKRKRQRNYPTLLNFTILLMENVLLIPTKGIIVMSLPIDYVLVNMLTTNLWCFPMFNIVLLNFCNLKKKFKSF